MHDLSQDISRVRRRIKQALAFRYGATGLSVGLLAVAVGIGLLGRWIPWFWQVSPWSLTLGLAGAGIAAGIFAALMAKLDDFGVARVLEQKANLKDRLTSAVWAGQNPSAETGALIEDARQAVRSVPVDRIIRPFKPSLLKLPAGSLAILALILIWPYVLSLPSGEARERLETIKNQGTQLRKVASEVKKDAALDAEFRKQIAEEMDKLGKELESGRLNEEEARVKLQQMEDKLTQMAEEMDRASSAENMRQIPADFQQAKAEISQKKGVQRESADQKRENGKAGAKADEGQAQGSKADSKPEKGSKDSEGRAASGEKGKPGQAYSSEKMEQVAESLAQMDFQKASSQLNQISEELRGMSSGELSQLADDLEAMGKALDQAGLSQMSQQMSQASQSLKEGNKGSASKSVDQAGKTSQSMSNASAASQTLQQASGACQMSQPGSGSQQAGSQSQGQQGSQSQASQQGQGQSQQQGSQGQGSQQGQGQTSQSGQGQQSGQGSQPGQADQGGQGGQQSGQGQASGQGQVQGQTSQGGQGSQQGQAAQGGQGGQAGRSSNSQSPSGGYNQYGPSPDYESRDGRGIGNPANAPRQGHVSPLNPSWTRLYDPRYTQTETKDLETRVEGGGKGERLKEKQENAPGNRGTARLPVLEVYPEYKAAAEKALGKEEIPASQRQRVKQYFDTLR